MRSRLGLVVVLAGALAGTGAIAGSGLPVPSMPQARDFVRTIDNPYLPLRPGTTFVYRGTKGRARTEDRVVVTHRRKTILGVPAVVVLDRSTVGGRPEEKTFDWYAQDRSGAVWYLGEDSFDYERGHWVRNDGSWRAGVRGARAGILMEAEPRPGDAYRQELSRGNAEDLARVLSTTARVTVPYGSFRRALETREWTPLEPGVVEHKYYARGVGEVRSVMVRGGTEEAALVSVVTGG